MTHARTRFAPSPTGLLHVGGIRTALFAWLIARKTGGQFILRLEDTDQKREVAGADQHIIDCLHALGLDYDEGPDIGGPSGPYRQSERLEIYRTWAQKLIDSGRAYADPYTPEQINDFRDAAIAAKKPFLYRAHRPQAPQAWDGTTALRFKSDPKAYQWHDEVMGSLQTGPEVIDDFILIKSDGYPTYNFAHIVDDAEMAISHVIRGQEFISSMPNYLNLYEALGFDMTPANHERSREFHGEEQDSELTSESQRKSKPLLPTFATLPHILGPTGAKKLSKRDGAKDVLDYLRDGYLQESLISFIATLGWNDGTEQELFARDELVEKFSLERVGRSGARFDEQRLLWVNGQFIRQLSKPELLARASATVVSDTTVSFWPTSALSADEYYKNQVLELAQERLKTLADLPQLTDYFFEEPKVDLALLANNKQLKKISSADLTDMLKVSREELSRSVWAADSIQDCLNLLLEKTGQKPGILFSLIRIAVTWAPFSPALNETLALLGKQRCLDRIDLTIKKILDHA